MCECVSACMRYLLTAHVWKSTSFCVLCFPSTTVEPVVRFSAASVRLSTPLFQSLGSRRKCVCASPASSCLTSESTDVVIKMLELV